MTLTIDNTDQTFATSSGATQINSTPVTAMAFGSAGSCDHNASGIANIDLQDTPFAVALDAFQLEGAGPVGGATYSADNQVVDLTGGGYCGAIDPVTAGKLPLAYIE